MSSSISGFEQLLGSEWQSLCMRVLKEYYGPGNLVDIPDEDRGDGGLEAFTLSGDAYQCYAPENEPLSAAQRRSKHISKLTTDCGKFISNSEVIKKYVTPGLQIRKWMLLVPRISTKEVRNHCATLTTKVREAGLTYVAPDIVVTVVTLDDFEGARQAVIARQLSVLSLPPVQRLSFADLGDERSEMISTKLSKTSAYSDPARRNPVVDRFLEAHLRGKVHRDFVSDQYSELSDALEASLDDLESRLVLQYSLQAGGNDALLGAVLRDTERLVKGALNVNDADARVIAEGQVAEWLMRCPLDFAG